MIYCSLHPLCCHQHHQNKMKKQQTILVFTAGCHLKHTHTHTRTNLHAHTHAHRQTHIHTHKYKHTHTHTHTGRVKEDTSAGCTVHLAQQVRLVLSDDAPGLACHSKVESSTVLLDVDYTRPLFLLPNNTTTTHRHTNHIYSIPNIAHTHTHTHTLTHTHAPSHILQTCTLKHKHMHAHTHLHTNMHTCTHTHMYTPHVINR